MPWSNRMSFESLHLCGVTAVVAVLASLIQPEFASSGFNKLPIASAYIAAPLRLGCPTAASLQRTRRSSRIIFSSGDSRTEEKMIREDRLVRCKLAAVGHLHESS